MTILRLGTGVGMVVGLAGALWAAEAPSGTPVSPDAATGWTQAREWVHGTVEHQAAYRLDQPREFTKLRSQLLLTESHRLNDEVRFSSTQRVFYDAVYSLTDNFPDSATSSLRAEAELRDTYVDVSYEDFDVRLGKQQIVWGDAVGWFVADVVNAKDLREYVLPDFDLIRIPQWGADVEWTAGDGHVELVWLPEHAFHRLAVSGSEFEQPYPVPPGIPFTLTDPSKPPQSVNNSEAGMRASYLWEGWDVSGFYLYSWDKVPVLYRSITPLGVWQFSPAYERAHVIGASFSKDLGEGTVLKGEASVNPKAHFSTLDITDGDGVVERPVFDVLLGADHTFFDTLDLNVQFIQRAISNFSDAIANEQDYRAHLSFWAHTEWLDGKVEPECLVIAGLTMSDVVYRPKVTVNLTDAWQTAVGADVFQGDTEGLFGRFDKKSRVYAEVSLHF